MTPILHLSSRNAVEAELARRAGLWLINLPCGVPLTPHDEEGLKLIVEINLNTRAREEKEN